MLTEEVNYMGYFAYHIVWVLEISWKAFRSWKGLRDGVRFSYDIENLNTKGWTSVLDFLWLVWTEIKMWLILIMFFESYYNIGKFVLGSPGK